jgi:hypothetical protein
MEKSSSFSDMKRLAVSALLLLSALTASAQIGGTAGSFERLGFGARGMGMGNALTAVSTGEISTYYNPALSPFAARRTFDAGFGFLSLDRSLHFVSYTQALPPSAGLSFGIINAGVGNIDGRDNDGLSTGTLSTSENEFVLSFANRVDPRVSLGVAIKLLYAKLYDQVTSTTVGFDIGAAAILTDDLTLGVTIQDIGSKYKWDTKSLYAENGSQTENKFPLLRRVALSGHLPGTGGIADVEFENSSEGSNIIRIGAEWSAVEQVAFRAGLDRWELSSNATGVKPTFGFTVRNSFNGWTPVISYAFVVEGFAPHGMHVINVAATF